MFGGYEIWLLVALIAVIFGLPKLQRRLEQRVDEDKLGAEILADLRKRVRVEPLGDGPGVQILAEFHKVRRLRVSRYQLHGSDEAGINAIALPGGTVVVTQGLLQLFDRGVVSRDELAAVLAHEVAHIELGHSRAAEVRETMGRWATMALPGASLGPAVRMAMKAGVGALRKRASRDAELQADAWAADLLRRTPYDNNSLATFLAKTAAWSGGGGLWSTHPSAEARIEALRQGS